MNVELDTLNHWRAYFEQLRKTMKGAESALAAGNLDRARELVEFTRVSAVRMGHKLEEAGADRPEHMPDPPEIPLELMDTPANRRFFHALREAAHAGRVVDSERGWGEDGPAEYLEDWASKVEMEIYGPEGAGEGIER